MRQAEIDRQAEHEMWAGQDEVEEERHCVDCGALLKAYNGLRCDECADLGGKLDAHIQSFYDGAGEGKWDPGYVYDMTHDDCPY